MLLPSTRVRASEPGLGLRCSGCDKRCASRDRAAFSVSSRSVPPAARMDGTASRARLIKKKTRAMDTDRRGSAAVRPKVRIQPSVVFLPSPQVVGEKLEKVIRRSNQGPSQPVARTQAKSRRQDARSPDPTAQQAHRSNEAKTSHASNVCRQSSPPRYAKMRRCRFLIGPCSLPP